MEHIVGYINEVFIVSSAIFIAIGWYMIRKGRIETHKRLMVTGSILAALFFISYVLKTLFVGDTTFGGPASMKGGYQAFLQAHSFLATVGGILGIISIRTALKARFGTHKKVGPWTATIWFITAATGLVVFVMLYVIYPSGTTTSLWNAWLGH